VTKRNAKAVETGAKRDGKTKVGPGHPPLEHRFREGNQAAVGHGRPRKLAELKELILETLAQDAGLVEGQRLTRAQAMIRLMISKSPSDRLAILEYAFGKVPTQNRERTFEDDILDLLLEGKITEAEVQKEVPEYAARIIAAYHLRRNESGAVESHN